MRLGVIGLPQSGKTTIFNALTRGNQPVSVSGGRFDVHTAVVDVPDARVKRLEELFKPHKTTYAKVTYADIAGLEAGASRSGFSGALLNQLSQMDGFLEVVRYFEDDGIPHPTGSVDACRDIRVLDEELLLQDLITVERKLERLAGERNKGNGRDKAFVEQETGLFEKLQATLSNEKPLRDIDFSHEEEKIISGYGFLTRKPILILMNLSEGQSPPEVICPYRRCSVARLQGRLEMDIVQLPPEDASAFMVEYGIEEPGLNKAIRMSYDLLGLQSFFTVGQDEVRAWTVRRGASAQEAAGVIHSDLQKGFIRAEVVSYGELVELGGLNEARTRGRLRLEGKTYLIQDGEIVHVRFNL